VLLSALRYAAGDSASTEGLSGLGPRLHRPTGAVIAAGQGIGPDAASIVAPLLAATVLASV